MKPEIQKAYETAGLTQDEAVQLYEKLMRRAEAEQTRPARRMASTPRRLAVAAAVAVLAALMASAGYAAYRHWALPAPKTYEPGKQGIYEEHTRNEYSLSDLEDSSSTETASTAPERPTEAGTAPAPEADAPVTPDELSDEALIRKGLDILQQVGMLDLRPEQLTLVRQENLFWGREEAEVEFEQNGISTSVKFNAETGRFLGMNGIDWQLDGASACESDAAAAALARRYYEALPVEQGYVMSSVEKYDAQYWSYDFCREVEPGVFNQYEMVRVAINPVSGRLTGCVVFYVPLLDDHEAGQERISRERAEQIAQSLQPELLDGMTLVSAELTIGLPNWNYTQYAEIPNRQASQVSRWVWALTYRRENSEFDEQVHLLVDCYTGELLGGDATK